MCLVLSKVKEKHPEQRVGRTSTVVSAASHKTGLDAHDRFRYAQLNMEHNLLSDHFTGLVTWREDGKTYSMLSKDDMPFGMCNCTRLVGRPEPVVRLVAVDPQTGEVALDVVWCLKCDLPRGPLPADMMDHFHEEQ